jgi:hypothetical protein
VAGRCPVLGSHRTEFAVVGVVVAVVGVIDEVDGDDSRPVRVENRYFPSDVISGIESPS